MLYRLQFPQQETLERSLCAALAAPLTRIVMAEHRGPFCRYFIVCTALLHRDTTRWQPCLIFIHASTAWLCSLRSVRALIQFINCRIKNFFPEAYFLDSLSNKRQITQFITKKCSIHFKVSTPGLRKINLPCPLSFSHHTSF